MSMPELEKMFGRRWKGSYGNKNVKKLLMEQLKNYRVIGYKTKLINIRSYKDG